MLRAPGYDPSGSVRRRSMRRTLDALGAVAADFVCSPTPHVCRPRSPHLREEAQRPLSHRQGAAACRTTGDRGSRISPTAHPQRATSWSARDFRSDLRAEVLPDVKPDYAGYIAWRGLVNKDAIPAPVHADIFDAMVFGLPPNEQFIRYPAPAATTI